MSSGLIKARVSAVQEVAHGISSYGRSLTAALASARADLNRTGAEFQSALANSQRKLQAAERRTEMAQAELARCREGCEPLQRALAECRVAQDLAKRDHERNLQAQARFDRAAAELLSSMRTVQTSAETIVPTARQHVQEYAEKLAAYLKTGV